MAVDGRLNADQQRILDLERVLKDLRAAQNRYVGFIDEDTFDKYFTAWYEEWERLGRHVGEVVRKADKVLENK